MPEPAITSPKSNHATGAFHAAPGIVLDYRRAIFLEDHRALVLGDLHLGYNWSHRRHGQMLPIQPHNRLGPRISELVQAYDPERVVLLGDVVHQTVDLVAVENELQELIDAVGSRKFMVVQGNHDKHLNKSPLTNGWERCRECRLQNIVLVHGDKLKEHPSGAELVLMGHEHPAIQLGDGIATSARFPCFLLSPDIIVLPAFSLWAAGTVYGSHPLMSPLARHTRFTHAVAIMGERLLRVPLKA